MNLRILRLYFSENEFWILKAKGKFDSQWIRDVKREIYVIFKRCDALGDSSEAINSMNYMKRNWKYL